jgi:hypothetical protein
MYPVHAAHTYEPMQLDCMAAEAVSNECDIKELEPQEAGNQDVGACRIPCSQNFARLHHTRLLDEHEV